MSKKRKLTPQEKQFVAEAEEYAFSVDYGPDGAPFAMGADKNSHCFSMAVEEKPDGQGDATYHLK
jgi:hypothetical protein